MPLRNVPTITLKSTNLSFLWLPSACLGTKGRLHRPRSLCLLRGNEDYVSEALEKDKATGYGIRRSRSADCK